MTRKTFTISLSLLAGFALIASACGSATSDDAISVDATDGKGDAVPTTISATFKTLSVGGDWQATGATELQVTRNANGWHQQSATLYRVTLDAPAQLSVFGVGSYHSIWRGWFRTILMKRDGNRWRRFSYKNNVLFNALDSSDKLLGIVRNTISTDTRRLDAQLPAGTYVIGVVFRRVSNEVNHARTRLILKLTTAGQANQIDCSRLTNYLCKVEFAKGRCFWNAISNGCEALASNDGTGNDQPKDDQPKDDQPKDDQPQQQQPAGKQSRMGGCYSCDLSNASCVGRIGDKAYGLKCMPKPASDNSCTYSNGNDFRQCVTASGSCAGWQFCQANGTYSACQEIGADAQGFFKQVLGPDALTCL